MPRTITIQRLSEPWLIRREAMRGPPAGQTPRTQDAIVVGYCGRSSSSFSQLIFSDTQMCSVGAKALRSSKVASATPARVPLRRQENNRVPQLLQNTLSSASEEG